MISSMRTALGSRVVAGGDFSQVWSQSQLAFPQWSGRRDMAFFARDCQGVAVMAMGVAMAFFVFCVGRFW